MKPVSPSTLRAVSWAALLGAGFALGGCASVDNFLSGDKVDYRGQARRTASLEVPPDLTQLAKESRYQAPQGTVSASTLAATVPAAAAAVAPAGAAVGSGAVAPGTVGDFTIERNGNLRVLKTRLTPDQLWPQVRAFWQERGFAIAQDSPEAGVMETDWAENRAKLPRDGVRKLIGGILDGLFSTGERDRFRTRVERTATGSELLITHRGMEEVFADNSNQRTVWRTRPSDPELEGEMLARLLVKLGAGEDSARASVAASAAPTAAPAAARARLRNDAGASALDVDDNFDRTWRRVGVALDRNGFTVEDRDRNAGIYFVRYVDPKVAGKEEPGFFSRLFGKDGGSATPARYRINVKAAGDKSQVSVLNAQGAADGSEVAMGIARLLVDDLK